MLIPPNTPRLPLPLRWHRTIDERRARSFFLDPFSIYCTLDWAQRRINSVGRGEWSFAERRAVNLAASMLRFGILTTSHAALAPRGCLMRTGSDARLVWGFGKNENKVWKKITNNIWFQGAFRSAAIFTWATNVINLKFVEFTVSRYQSCLVIHSHYMHPTIPTPLVPSIHRLRHQCYTSSFIYSDQVIFNLFWKVENCKFRLRFFPDPWNSWKTFCILFKKRILQQIVCAENFKKKLRSWNFATKILHRQQTNTINSSSTHKPRKDSIFMKNEVQCSLKKSGWRTEELNSTDLKQITGFKLKYFHLQRTPFRCWH